MRPAQHHSRESNHMALDLATLHPVPSSYPLASPPSTTCLVIVDSVLDSLRAEQKRDLALAQRHTPFNLTQTATCPASVSLKTFHIVETLLDSTRGPTLLCATAFLTYRKSQTTSSTVAITKAPWTLAPTVRPRQATHFNMATNLTITHTTTIHRLSASLLRGHILPIRYICRLL